MDRDSSTFDLVREAQSGSREAFDELQSRFRLRVESFVRLRARKLLRRVAVEDVVQDIFTRAFQALPRFEWQRNGSFPSWLGGIAEKVILHLTRYYDSQKRAGNHVPLPPAGGPADASNATPSRLLRREERFQRFVESLNRLSEKHREVILLARVNELSMAEISKRMQCSKEAASMLLLRAVRNLKSDFGSTDSFHLPPERIEELFPPGSDDGGAA